MKTAEIMFKAHHAVVCPEFDLAPYQIQAILMLEFNRHHEQIKRDVKSKYDLDPQSVSKSNVNWYLNEIRRLKYGYVVSDTPRRWRFSYRF